MDDQELAGLFQQLQQVQEAKPRMCLSERVVVELVQKLTSLGHFKDELLHTINGREYITKTQVRHEILQALQSCRGRIAVLDLPSLIGVDLPHCEQAARSVVDESGGDIALTNGELISSAYFTDMAQEIQDMLRATAAVEVGAIAKRFSLSAEEVGRCIQKHLGSTIHGTQEGSVLFTPAFLSLVKAFLRGALRGAVTAVCLTDLLRDAHIPLTTALSPKLLGRLVTEMQTEGAVAGTWKPAGLLFTPQAYVDAQQQSIREFFDQNGYIEYNAMRKMGIDKPKTAARKLLANGLELQAVFAAPHITAQMDASVEAMSAAPAVLDAAALLPPVLPPADVSQLLDRSDAVRRAVAGGGLLVAGRFLLNMTAVDTCRTCAAALGQEAAKGALEAPTARTRTGTGARPAGSAAKTDTASGVTGVADADDDDEGGRRKGKKGKASKRRAKAGAMNAGLDGAAGKRGAADPTAAFLPTEEALAQRLSTEMADLMEAAAEEADEVAQPAASAFLPAAVEVFQSELKAGTTQAAERTRLAHVRAAQSAFTELLLRHRGLDALTPAGIDSSGTDGDMDADALAAREAEAAQWELLQKHLMRTHGGPAVDAALRLAAVTEQVGVEEGTGGVGDEAAKPLAAAARDTMVAQLPGDLSRPAGAVCEALKSGVSSTCIQALTTLLPLCGAAVQAMDRKAELVAVQRKRNDLVAELQDPQRTLPDVFSGTVQCLLMAHFEKLVSAPGRCTPYLLSKLRHRLDGDSFRLLGAAHARVLEVLSAGGRGEEDAAVAACKEGLLGLCAAAVVAGT